MIDPRHRLNRAILGESVLTPRRSESVVHRPEVIRPRTVELRDPKDVRAHSVRTTRRIVEAAPNAPKLLRLIRRRYAEECARPVRGKPWRMDRTITARESCADQVRSALHREARLESPRPTRPEPGLPERPRISADAWLAGAEE